MLLNYIWVGFLLAGFVVALVRVIGYYYRDFFADALGIIFDRADLEVFSAIVNSTFDMAETSVKIAIYLIGVMTLWLGIMKIGERGGAINALSRVVSPFFRKIFPELPANHPAIGSMLMNFCANMLGLDNAATPLGLKAMKDLQKVNTKKDTASNSMIMFIVLNTSGLTIIPISIMAIRAASGAKDPTDVFVPLLLATYFATLAGLIAVAIVQKINLFNRVVLAYLGGLTAIIALVIWYLTSIEQPRVEVISRFAGNFILFMFIITFIWLGIRKKINIYESFIDGAKEGFEIAIKIIPYLVAMLFAMDFIIGGLDKFFGLFGINTDFIPALPVAFMKPLSGSGARGLMVEAMQTYGADSFVGRLASTFQGTTETTFYTLAVYFGAVSIKKVRHAVSCGLIADLAGIIAAIFIAYLFFH
jgi:spore maturation protein SpmA